LTHRWRPLAAVTLAAVVLTLGLHGFNGAHGASVKVTATPRGPTVTPPLRLAMPDTITTVDPALVADDENVQLSQLLYSGLVRLNSSYHVVPDAASSYKISSDHRVYTFRLRKGLRFSNGDAVTARDFVFSITRSLSPSLKSPSAPTYQLDILGARPVLEGKSTTVSGLKALDSSTLQITTRWPMPYFLMELTYPTSYVLDRRRIAKLGPPDNTSWYADPIGTGPYRLKQWVPNDRIVLSRNPYYAGPKASIKTVSISLSAFTDSGTSLYRFITKSLDIVALSSSDTSLGRLPGVREANMLAVTGIYMSFKARPFNNGHLRHALTLALPRPQLVIKALGTAATPFDGFVPPGEWGYFRGLRVPAQDVVQARKELAAAGFPGGRSFPATTLYYGIDPVNATLADRVQRLASLVAKAWKSVLNISIATQGLTLNTLYSEAQSDALPLYISGWSADYPDPHDWLSGLWKMHALNNNVNYSNKHFDTLVSAADVTWDPSRRLRLYNRAQQQLVDDDAWIPLYIPHRVVYVRPDIGNLVLTGYGLIPKSGSWASVQLASSGSKSKPHA
jgi:peptide/nickel transport system substrate-binding protein/oligopeptide transport system substrate-binding protein